MSEARHIGCLLVGLSGIVVGCGEAPSPGEFRTVSQSDANQSQAALNKTVVADPMTDDAPAATAEPMPADDKTSEKTVVAQDKAASAVTAEPVASVTTPTDSAPEKAAEPKTAPKLLVTEKEFSTTAPENSLRVTFDDIDLEKIFEIKEVSKDLPQHFPKWLKGLDGQRVRIRGYMVPTFQADDLVAFTLARDTSACCFGPNPKVSYLIEVSMKKGKTSEYIDYRPFDVVGVLHVGDEVSPGRLYQIDDAVVIRK